MAPHNLVLQPVIQFGTAIHGQGFSGSAPNGVQKSVGVQKANSPSREEVRRRISLLSARF